MTRALSTSIQPSLAALPQESAVVLPYFLGDDLFDVPDVAELGGEALKSAISRGEVSGERYGMTHFHSEDRPTLLVAGAGPRAENRGFELRRLAAAAAHHLVSRGYRLLCIVDRGAVSAFDFARSVVEGASFGAYDPGLRKTRAAPPKHLDKIILISREDTGELERGAKRGTVLGDAIMLARDLVNLPPNELTPSAFADRAARVAERAGLGYQVLDQDAMREIGMGSLLGVASGSHEPPRLIVLKHGSEEASVKLALVGKGITFDSGGLSLKSHEGMEHMKGDMGGAAAVVAAMVSIATLGINGISVSGYAGCTENMPGGSAMRPGDVLTALNGETIEVLNTDAEGRLVLADVLAYAVRQGATHLVDVATLTGGAVVALGHAATLSTGRPMDWVHEVVASAEEGLERAWPMPIFEEYRRAVESEIADIKNTGGRYASALTAAAFLGDFVNGARWAHLDIAGTSWADESTPYQQKGGTGAGVGTLVSVADRLSHASDR
jgi:leucyl aminopeptidase